MTSARSFAEDSRCFSLIPLNHLLNYHESKLSSCIAIRFLFFSVNFCTGKITKNYSVEPLSVHVNQSKFYSSISTNICCTSNITPENQFNVPFGGGFNCEKGKENAYIFCISAWNKLHQLIYQVLQLIFAFLS